MGDCSKGMVNADAWVFSGGSTGYGRRLLSRKDAKAQRKKEEELENHLILLFLRRIIAWFV